jgi:GNAT superfamily N-acetyltransferase
MHLIEAVELTSEQRLAIMRLWNNEYPQQICYKTLDDFDHYLHALAGKIHLLLMDDQCNIKGWGFLFERSGENWFAIIIDRPEQGNGYGRKILDLLKSKTDHMGGWVTDHNLYTTAGGAQYLSPLEFYLKNGFSLCPEIRLETDKLSAVKVVWHA